MKFLLLKYEELGQKTTLSKQEKELDKILENYVFYNDKTSKIFLDIQALEHISFKDLNMEFRIKNIKN